VVLDATGEIHGRNWGSCASHAVKMGKDFYEILGIGKDADQNAIKKAYRKLAVKWHPDKNIGNEEMAETKFKQINEAYEILSDENNRRTYDQFGEDGLKGGMGGMPGGFAAGDPSKIFEQFFGGAFADAAAFAVP
jgi:DnaJ-class molecular chaperone